VQSSFLTMAGIANAMDAGMHCMSQHDQGQLCSKTKNMSMLAAYFVIGTWATVVWHHFTDKDFSVVLTMSSITQFLGFVLLALKVRWAKSAAGLSSKTLEMYFIFFMFRLSSTVFKNGYLPIDRSGDWVYQSADVMSVFLVLHLLYVTHKTYGTTYQAAHDSLDIFKAIPACAVLAFFVKGDLNSSPFFDWVWTTSLLLDTIAMLPQLWMMTKVGGKIDGMTSHYVIALTISRGFAFAFWWHGYTELHIEGQAFNKAGYTVLLAHILQMVLCADFLYYYVKGMMSGRGTAVLPNIEV